MSDISLHNQPSDEAAQIVADENEELRQSLYSLTDDGLLITTPHMDSFGVAFHQPTGLFLCCESAFLLEGVISHLGGLKHRKTGVNTPLLDHIARVGPLLNPLRDLEDFVYSEEPREAIPRLPILANASGCSLCALTGRKRHINKHLETKPHPESAMPAVRLDGFKCQRLSQGKFTRNFRVYDGAAPRNNASGTLGDKVAAFKWQTYLPNPIPNARMVNPLLNRTKWHEHIGPHHTDVPKFRALVAYPEPAEFPNLKFAVGKYFTKGIEKLDKTEELVLQKLNTHDPDKSGINNTPLHEHHQGDSTVAQYLVPITRFVAALLRHVAWVPSKRPPLDLEITPELERTLTRLHTQLKNKSSTHKSLHKLFKLLWHRPWSITAESTMPDPTLRFLMFFCLMEGGDFMRAKDISGPIRKINWAIQFCGLTEIHRLVESGECASQLLAYEQIKPYVTEKTGSPYSSLWSLMHYVTTLSMQTMAMPHVWWLDTLHWERMLFKGNRINLTQIEAIFTNIEDQLVDLWENKVCLGESVHVKCTEFADDLTNTNPGYSFINDPKNPFSALRNAFVDAIMANPELMKMFCTQESNYTTLNLGFCRTWLADLAKFEGLLMLMVDMLGGAPPRGTELVSMLAQNTALRLRNLAGLGAFVAIIRQYDKTSNITQCDRLIPHSVHAVAADLIVQLHTFIRPFAMYIAAQIAAPSVVADYSQMLFMAYLRPFTSQQLSDLMAKSCIGVLDWEMKIADWRHVNIAWRRKLCGGAAELVDNDTTSNLNALQAGHSAKTERLVYGLSPDALMGAPEDALPLFLGVSSEWQKVTRTVPGGLGLDYREARRCHFDSLLDNGIISPLTRARVSSTSIADAVASGPATGARAPLATGTLSEQMTAFHDRRAEAEQTILSNQQLVLARLARIEAQMMILVEGKSTIPLTDFPDEVMSGATSDIEMLDFANAQEVFQAKPADPPPPPAANSVPPPAPASNAVAEMAPAPKSRFPVQGAPATSKATNSLPTTAPPMPAGPSKLTKPKRAPVKKADDSWNPLLPPVRGNLSAPCKETPLGEPRRPTADVLADLRSQSVFRRDHITSSSPTIPPPTPVTSSQIQATQTTRVTSSPVAQFSPGTSPAHKRRRDGERRAGRPRNASPTPASRTAPHPRTALPLEPVVSNEFNITTSLQELLGDPAADWRDMDQYNMARECAALTRDIMLTTCTGSGKTLALLATVVREKGVTVIICPLASLLDDWERRLKRYKVGYEVFESESNPFLGNHNVVLVSADGSKKKTWQPAVNKISQRVTVIRVVGDEGHMWGLDREFRPEAFGQPYQLRLFPFQLVIMSATVSKAMEHFLQIEFGMGKNFVRIGSAGSHRPELRLVVESTHRDIPSQTKRVSKLLAAMRKTKKPNDRYIVFVNTSSDVSKGVARDLGAELYHSGTGDEASKQKRQRIFKQWLEGKTDLLVCTSALGAGMDYSSVRGTFHIGTTFDISSFEQQRGRAGRDGKPAVNYLLCRPNRFNPESRDLGDGYGDLGGMQEMSDLVWSKPESFPMKCHAYQMTNYFDVAGGHTCAEYGVEGDMRCGPCQTRTGPVEPRLEVRVMERHKPLIRATFERTSGKRKLNDAFEEITSAAMRRTNTWKAAEKARFQVWEDILELIDQRCGYCYAMEEEGDHALEKCPNLNSDQHRKIRILRTSICYDWYKYRTNPCYLCHIQSMGGDRFHDAMLPEPSDTSPPQCRNPHAVLGLAIAIFSEPAFFDHAHAHFRPESHGLSWDSLSQFIAWMMAPDPHGLYGGMQLLRYWHQRPMLPREKPVSEGDSEDSDLNSDSTFD